jgi:hypothetical protein
MIAADGLEVAHQGLWEMVMGLVRVRMGWGGLRLLTAIVSE